MILAENLLDKKGAMPKGSNKPPADESKVVGKLTNKIVQNLNMDRLSDVVAEQISEKIMSNFRASYIVDKLLYKYREQLHDSITEAIVQQL